MNKVAWLNIAFMIASTIVAYLYPLELLLFSYAVLGPAHYLTEISWLHDRDYFTRGPREYLPLVIITLLSIFVPLGGIPAIALFICFSSAFFIIVLGSNAIRTGLITFFGLLVVILRARIPGLDGVAVLLATIIHVYVFTGLFILLGALKRRSLVDLLSLGVYVGSACILLATTPAVQAYPSDSYAVVSGEYFFSVGKLFRDALGLPPSRELPVIAFMAFAYTYHYLNWFSKTRLIGWHRISRLRLTLIVLIYTFSLCIYWIDFRLGFTILLSIAVLHVTLEFPLNHRTMLGLGAELRRLMRRRPA